MKTHDTGKSERLFLEEFRRELKYHFSEYLDMPLITPHWVYISVSHKCNNDCIMCCVKDILTDKNLSSAKIKEVLGEVSVWESEPVVVFTGGETFMRSDIFELIKTASDLGIVTEAVTNGSLVTKSMAEKIVTSGLSNIAVSVDGATKTTHDTVRGREGSFSEIKTALLNLSEAKRKFGADIQVSAWVTIMAQNVGELEDIYSLSKSCGVECLVYHPVINMQDDMQNTDTATNVWLDQRQMVELEKQIRWLNTKKNDSMVARLHDPELFASYFKSSIDKGQWKCNPYEFINIGPDGMVSSCGEGFGNVFEMSLVDTLNTKSAKRARVKMKECKKPCLQTCWSRPSADNLSLITEKFVGQADVLPKENRENYLKQGTEILNHFKNML